MYRFMGGFTVTRGRFPPGDQGTRMTLDQMRKLALEGAQQFGVRHTALRILESAGAAGHDPRAELQALYQFVRDRITFRADIAGVETLQSPRYTLTARAGDCDDKAVLLAALARAVGIPAELAFRVVALNRATPGAFSHVYVVARVQGQAIALDPTYPETPMGWEPRRPFRMSEVPV